MCNGNPMLVSRQQLIVETIQENYGERKVLDEWHKIINEALPEPKRMTKRSLTHIIGIMGRSGCFVLVKDRCQRNTFYMFKE